MNVRFIALGLVFAVVLGLLVFQATKTSSAVVLTPTEILAKGPGKSLSRIRVGGRVADREISYQLEPEIVLSFEILDPAKPGGTVPVVYRGLKPDMFAAGRDVIIDGDYVQGSIRATKLLTQCPSKYEPPVPSQEGSSQGDTGSTPSSVVPAPKEKKVY